MRVHDGGSVDRQLDFSALAGGEWSPVAVRLSYYLLVPAAYAGLLTLARAGVPAVLPLPLALVTWLVLICVGWWTANLAASASFHLLRPWRPPWWFLCLAGSVGQALLLSPFYRTVFAWADAQAGISGLYADTPLPEFSLVYGLTLASYITPGFLWMLAVVYFYHRALGYSRFRYPEERLPTPAPPEAREPVISPPPFLERSCLPRDSEIWAVTAEEHYVRIYSNQGSDLVRYRFSAAVDELSENHAGLQVHRSWWVRPDRVVSWEDRGRTVQLVLCNGVRVPVSTAYRVMTLARLDPGIRTSPGSTPPA